MKTVRKRTRGSYQRIVSEGAGLWHEWQTVSVDPESDAALRGGLLLGFFECWRLQHLLVEGWRLPAHFGVACWIVASSADIHIWAPRTRRLSLREPETGLKYFVSCQGRIRCDVAPVSLELVMHVVGIAGSA